VLYRSKIARPTRSPEEFWDKYGRTWRIRHPRLEVLGDEWGGANEFITVLKEFCKPYSVVAEIGCGWGRISKSIVDSCARLVCQDISSEMIRRAKSRLENKDNCFFVKSDGKSLRRLGYGNFDLVFSHDVFVHFPLIDVYNNLEEVYKLLKNGGIFIVSFYDFEHHFSKFRKQALNYKAVPLDKRDVDIVRFVTPRQVQLMSKDVGFQAVDVLQKEDSVKRKGFVICILKK